MLKQLHPTWRFGAPDLQVSRFGHGLLPEAVSEHERPLKITTAAIGTSEQLNTTLETSCMRELSGDTTRNPVGFDWQHIAKAMGCMKALVGADSSDTTSWLILAQELYAQLHGRIHQPLQGLSSLFVNFP